MLQGHYNTQEQFRPVRFIEMEENDNGATRVVFVSDQVYSTREVLTNAFGVHGSPTPYVIEGGITVVERNIHHISTYGSQYIDVYYQEIYTGQVADHIPQYLEEHIGKTVQVVFQENKVTTQRQMENQIVTITEELGEVWEFATQNFVMNHHEDYFMLLGMTYSQCESADYDGRLMVNYSFIPKEETYMEYYCEVCDVTYDGRDEQAVGNHQMCFENANRQFQSDPDAVVVVEEDNDSDEESDSGSDEESDSGSDEESDSGSDEENEDDNEIDNRDIYIPREIDWNDPVDDEEDDEQRNIQRNRNENEYNNTDVERGEEEIQDFITAHYPVLNSNIHRSDYDAYNNNNRVFPGLIGEPQRIST